MKNNKRTMMPLSIRFDGETIRLNVRPEQFMHMWHSLMAADELLIGTAAYMGIAYFWHADYKHYLRDIDNRVVQAVHNEMLKSGLALDGSSAEHLNLIRSVLVKMKSFCPISGERWTEDKKEKEENYEKEFPLYQQNQI